MHHLRRTIIIVALVCLGVLAGTTTIQASLAAQGDNGAEGLGVKEIGPEDVSPDPANDKVRSLHTDGISGGEPTGADAAPAVEKPPIPTEAGRDPVPVKTGPVNLPAQRSGRYSELTVTPLQNGGFELGRTVWTEYSQNGWDLILHESSTFVPARSGSWLAWLGGDSDEISIISQTVTVPQGGMLRYYRQIISSDSCGWDYGSVWVDGALVFEEDLCTATETVGWEEVVVDLSAYSGQTVTLEFEATTDSSLDSSLYLDDISLEGTCYPLTVYWTNGGAAPVLSPEYSYGCTAGEYVAGEVVHLTAQPDPGWAVIAWYGTDDDSSTSLANMVTMPAAPRIVEVEYAPTSALTPLENGDFEQGPVWWDEFSSNGWDLICDVSICPDPPPHSGSWQAWLGGDNNEVSVISQEVTVPNGGILRYWRQIVSTDICGYDYGEVWINGFLLFEEELCGATATSDWEEVVIDLSAYTYQTVYLDFVVTTDFSGISALFIDDVTLEGTCYTLDLAQNGNGAVPTASPARSYGCALGEYVAGEPISLEAQPATHWRVARWSGTDNDSSTSVSNTVTMPAANHTVVVDYEQFEFKLYLPIMLFN